MLLPLLLALLLSGGAGSVAAQSWRPLGPEREADSWPVAPAPSPYLQGFAADAPQDGLGGGWSSETVPQSSGAPRFAPETPEGQGWRFRDDPALSPPAQAPASADAFRFRPLSEGERARHEVDSGWRPLEPERERGGAPPGAWPRAPWEVPR